jgi:arylsulfatase A-like enzyme
VENNEDLRDAFVRKLQEALDVTDGIPGQDREATNQLLRDADATLTRIRDENRRALEQVNRQVRIVNHHCPNIVLFLLNGVGYGELGAYGQQQIKTPVADVLAAHGTRFTQFYAGSCESVASRGTLYSGNLTARGEQAGEDWITVRERDVTLAEVLFQGGYETGLFGIWGVGPVARAGHPNSQGFKTFVGYLDDPSADDFYPPTLWCNGNQVSLPGNRAGAKTQYAPDVIVAAAQRFIDTEYRRPFFMTVALPMSVTENGVEVPDLSPYADRDWPMGDKVRAAMLTRVDRYLGQIVTQLQQRRILNRTMVILTSDRGPPSAPGGGEDRFLAAGELRGRAGELYEGGIRVPLIVLWPGARRAPAESDVPFGMWDLLPTLRDLTGTLRCPRTLDGVSLAGRLAGSVGDERLSRALLYWEKHRDGLAQAVRVEDWKGVRFGAEGRWELYDLKTDPAESRDVAEFHPDVVRRIDQLARFLQP